MTIFKLELAELSLPEIDVVLADSPDPDDEVTLEVPEEPRVGCGDGRDTVFLAQVFGEGAAIDCAFLNLPYNLKINGI